VCTGPEARGGALQRPHCPGTARPPGGEGVPAGRYLRRQPLLLVVLPGQHPPQLLHAGARAGPHRRGRDGTALPYRPAGPTGSDAPPQAAPPIGGAPRLRSGAPERGGGGSAAPRLRSGAAARQNSGGVGSAPAQWGGAAASRGYPAASAPFAAIAPRPVPQAVGGDRPRREG